MLRSLFILCCTSLLVESCGKVKLIIDTDAGSDDAIAILLLLRAELQSNYEIIAITCSYGNTNLKNVEVNVLKSLTIANRSDIPVYSGAKKPLLDNFSTDNIFGEDGFGDADFDQQIIGSVNRSIHASLAIIELSKQHAGELGIVVLGPTTNIALAASLDEGLLGRLSELWLMGSSVAGVGNYRPGVEFNFAADPEANSILLLGTGSLRPWLLPWEATRYAGFSPVWRRDVLGSLDSDLVRFLNAVEAVALSDSKITYIPADAMLVAVMLEPGMVNSTLETRLEPVLDGAARGAVLVDYRLPQLRTKPDNVMIIRSIDIRLYEELLLRLLA